MDLYHFLISLDYLLHGLLGFIYLYILTTNWRFGRKKVQRLMLACFILCAAVSIAILWGFGPTDMARLLLCIVGLAAGLFVCLYMPKYRDGRTLFIAFSAAVFNLVGIMLGEVVGSSDTSARMFIKIIIYTVMCLLVYRYFRKPLNRLMHAMEKGWHTLSSVPISLTVLCFALIFSEQVYHNIAAKFMAVALTAVIVCCYASLYYMFCTLQEQYRIKANYSMLEAQMGALQKQLEMTENTDRQLRIFRHDIRHYIALVQTCLENGNIVQGREIFMSMEKTLDKVTRKIPAYTNSPYVNAVIADYSGRADDARITFLAEMAEFSPQWTDNIELAVVVSNALENAWKACLELPEDMQRVISITGRPKERQYLLEIANTWPGKPADGNSQSHMELSAGENGHGYGIQSIFAFAKKYHVFVDFKTDGEWFRVRMIL